MKKLIKLLKQIFSPRVTYYYNDKKVTKLPKEIMEQFRLSKKELDKIFKEL